MSELSDFLNENFLAERNLSESEKRILLKFFQESEERYKRACEGQSGLHADISISQINLAELLLRRSKLKDAQKYLDKARTNLKSPPASSYCQPHWRGVVSRFNSRIEYYRSKGLKVEPISHVRLRGYTIPLVKEEITLS